MPVGLETPLQGGTKPSAFAAQLQWRVHHYLQNGDWEARIELAKHDFMKLAALVSLPLTLMLALLLRIVLKSSKPFLHIRFARWSSCSLGIWAIPTEVHLCQRDARMHPKRCLDLFFRYDKDAFVLKPSVRRSSAICNKELDKMFRFHLRLWQGAQFLDYLNRLLSRGSEEFILKMPDPYDRYGLFERFPTHLAFTKEEERRGKEGLRELGIEPGSPFVCFHTRGEAYLYRIRPRIVSLYGDWAHNDVRNASIHNYLLAAEKLADLGYTVIRMGKHVEEPIHSDNPRIIDYAWNHQSDFMDIYLSARCTFFIGQISGMTSVPMVFRRPVAFVNAYEMSEYRYCSHPNSVFIPKKFYSARESRLLNFREMVELGFINYHPKFTKQRALFDELGMEIHENTPEEIAEVVIEVHQRLQGTFALSEEDEELQRRFVCFLRSYPDVIGLEEGRPLRIGAHFLRTNQELLDEVRDECLSV